MTEPETSASAAPVAEKTETEETPKIRGLALAQKTFKLHHPATATEAEWQKYVVRGDY
jgi:hypothetical protein